jgi:hypothetical protein
MVQLVIPIFKIFAFQAQVVIEFHIEKFKEVGSFISQRAVYVDIFRFVLFEDRADQSGFA